jgi:hypothetical protein
MTQRNLFHWSRNDLCAPETLLTSVSRLRHGQNKLKNVITRYTSAFTTDTKGFLDSICTLKVSAKRSIRSNLRSSSFRPPFLPFDSLEMTSSEVELAEDDEQHLARTADELFAIADETLDEEMIAEVINFCREDKLNKSTASTE